MCPLGQYTSCRGIFDAGGSTGNHYYTIYPDGVNAESAYCAMEDDGMISGGGWTRLNSTISRSGLGFGTDDVLKTNNVPGNCGAPGYTGLVDHILVPHTQERLYVSRPYSIIQCATIAEGASGTYYWDGSSWVGIGMCCWNCPPFANGCSTCMSGLATNLRFDGTGGLRDMTLQSQCSDSSDNGQIEVTAWAY